MKHLLTTALLCGVSVLAAQAQNIVIIDKDGIPHKFNADYVQDITFEKVQSGSNYEITFDEVFVTTYGNQNISVTLNSGDNQLILDLWEPAAMFLQEGTYVADTSNDDFTFDPTYSRVSLDGVEEKLTGGTVTVARSGEVYSFSGEVTFGNGSLKFTCEDTLNTFGPTINFNFSDCVYVDVNDPAPNGFYYRFNDSNWKVEMRIDLFSEGNTPAPGVYNFGESTENGTASSYINLYSPYNEATSFTEGTVTVSEEGNNTVVEIEGKIEQGLTITAKYTGKLPERP